MQKTQAEINFRIAQNPEVVDLLEPSGIRISNLNVPFAGKGSKVFTVSFTNLQICYRDSLNKCLIDSKSTSKFSGISLKYLDCQSWVFRACKLSVLSQIG